jgi:hypothetical protein
MLRAQAAHGLESPAGAERWLRNAVVDELRRFETEEAPRCALYKEVLSWGLRDIVSLNFDLALAHAGGRRRLTHTPSKDRRPRGPSRDPSLFRRADVSVAGGTTRLWYPHGDTARADTLKLGVNAYGRAIRSLEGAVGTYHRKRRSHEGAPWSDALRDLPDGVLSWATVFLGSPLLFAGVGLSLDEWPLWWLLHRRARLHARLPPEQRPGTWTLVRRRTPDPVPDHLRGAPAGVTAVPVPSHPAVWQAARELFAP